MFKILAFSFLFQSNNFDLFSHKDTTQNPNVSNPCLKKAKNKLPFSKENQ